MNREIKFRAYSKSNNKIMEWDFIKKVGNLQKLLTLNHVKVIQFTGLKDKNGKEIYEGDHFGEPAYPVEFFDGAFFHEGELLRDTCGGMEVVGNIYEE